MPKVLMAAGIVVLAVVAAPVAAGILAGGLAGGIAAAGTALAGFGTALIGGAGLTAALSAWGTVALGAASALRPKPVGRGAAGSQVDFQADTMAGIPLVLGRSATAGKIVHANTSGTVNKNIALFYLVALSGGPIGGFEKLIASDFDCAFAGTNCTAPPQYANSMLLFVAGGAKPEPQAYYPPGVQVPWIPEWTAAHKTSGVATAWWTLVYDTKKFPNGIPKPLFVLTGPAVYDPRHDSTVAGGSGTQRWNDETTWSFQGNYNPFLQALTWCIGRRDNGKLTHGVGAPITAIDLPAFIEGANVCDANQWFVGGEVLSSDRKWDVLTTILQAGGGEPARLGGRLSAVVRTPRVTLGTITGKSLVGEASLTGTKRRRDRFNQIIPTYRSEAHQWQLVPAGAVTVDQYVAADGGLRSREASYPLVQQPKQAAELAAYDLVDAREFEPLVLPLGPAYAAAKPGDCFLVDEPEFGMIAQPVMVQQREVDPLTGQVTLTCRSESAGKHEYALGRVPNPPPIPGLTPVDPSFVSRPDLGSWTATGGVLAGPDGQQVPAIVVTGSVNDPNVAHVLVEHRLQLSPGVFGDFVTTQHPSTVRRVEIRAVVPMATYNVRVRYKTVKEIEGDQGLDLGLVTVGNLVSGGVTTIGGQTPAELIEQLNETTALGLETSQKAADNAAAILVTDANLYESTHLPDGTPLETYTVNGFATASANDQYSIKRVDAMGILRGDNLSFQMSQTTLWASPTQTWGQYQQSIQTNFNTTNANLTTETNLRVSADQALANQITTLSTTVGGNTSSITTLQNSVNGLNAQWVLAVSSQGPGYARVAGIKVAANPAVSSIAFQADQIGFTNGADNVYPLAVVGGKVIATNFQADDIKANTITANMIIGGAVTATAVHTAGIQTNAVNVEVEDQTWTFDSIGGVHLLTVYGELGTTTNNAAGCVFHLYCNGVEINFGSIYCPASWGGTGLSFPAVHQPGPGTHTYRLTHVGTTGSGASRVNRTNVAITELKR